MVWQVKETDLTPEAWDSLLRFLDPDRDVAARKLLDIQNRLMRILGYRGAAHPEDLAQETINRVATKSAELSEGYVGDPALYFLGVARNVFRESLREPARPLPMPEPEPPEEKELLDRCLEQCMEKLTPANRQLILEYYRGEKRAKIETRRRLAERLGIAVNALRIRACRIRRNLQRCVFECVELNAISN